MQQHQHQHEEQQRADLDNECAALATRADNIDAMCATLSYVYGELTVSCTWDTVRAAYALAGRAAAVLSCLQHEFNYATHTGANAHGRLQQEIAMMRRHIARIVPDIEMRSKRHEDALRHPELSPAPLTLDVQLAQLHSDAEPLTLARWGSIARFVRYVVALHNQTA